MKSNGLNLTKNQKMKKLHIISMLSLCTMMGYGQTWNTSLNGGTGLKLGTSSTQPLDFYTNNVKNMILDDHGILTLPKLGGTGRSLLFVDENGNLGRLPDGSGPNAGCAESFMPWFLGGNSNISNNTIGTCTNYDFILKSNNIESIFLKTNGYVGIGRNNSSPQAFLDVSDNTGLSTVEHMKIFGDLNGSIESTCEMRLFYKPGSPGFYVNEGVFGGASTTKFRVSNNYSYFYTNLSVTGNIGSTGVLSSAKLAVSLAGGVVPTDAIDVYESYSSKVNFRVKSSGNVYAREINVQITNFPDYVFRDNYKLRSLESLERYIQENKHLPEVPSASDIESNGANLGELSKIQMQKIEELTLYLIELKKEIENLKEKSK